MILLLGVLIGLLVCLLFMGLPMQPPINYVPRRRETTDGKIILYYDELPPEVQKEILEKAGLR